MLLFAGSLGVTFRRAASRGPPEKHPQIFGAAIFDPGLLSRLPASVVPA